MALPATLEISDTPARSGVVSRAAARLRVKQIPELGDQASLGSLLVRRAQHPDETIRYYCTLGSQQQMNLVTDKACESVEAHLAFAPALSTLRCCSGKLLLE